VAAAVLLVLPAGANAQSVTVNSFGDAVPSDCTPEPGGCTLREAMVSTSVGTIVNLPAGTYDLTEGALPADGNRFLAGAGARTTIITAGDRSRVMTVGGPVNVSGVTISDGNLPGGQGGGIYVGPGAELNLTDSAVLSSDALTGGGIYSEGTLRLDRSTIAGNFAEGAGSRGAGLAVADGDAKLFDTTISGNFSNATGAGLFTSANVELHNVTIARNFSDNAPPSGGGIQQAFDEPGDLTVAFNTLVVENEGGNCLGTNPNMIQARFSMADDELCNVPQAPEFGNQPIAPFTADISDLRNNGGPTDTHQLFGGSPATGTAEAGTCEGKFDQRGLSRDLGGACDIGAYERAATLSVTRLTEGIGFCTDDDCSLREAIDLVASEGAVDVRAGNYVLSRGALSVDDEVVVHGVGARVTTFTAGPNARVLHVFDDGFVTLIGVRITGGDVEQEALPVGPFGGGIAVTGAGVSLIDSAVDGNVAGHGGGIYVANGGALLTDTTVSDNEATDGEIGTGGGLYLSESLGLLENSTISGNSATRLGGGIATIGSELTLSSITIADNHTLSLQQTASAIFRATIPDDTNEIGETVARNTLIAGNPGTACSGEGPFDVTNVLTDNAACPGQVVGNALIGDLAANDAETDTHALLVGSPAIDAGANCPPFDQRGVTRSQGAACDVGAYESAGSSPPSSPPGGSGGGGGGGGGGTTQPPPEEPQEQLPPPEAGEEVNALPKSGTVRVKIAGSNRFVELEEGQQIPVGSVVDTTKGRVTIIAAGGQQADFYDGIFRLTQGTGAKPLTTLTLVEALSCPKAGNAIAAAKKKRRLWGDGEGRFRTKGKHSAATVVGTRWLVEDKCRSTLTRVVRGRVSVRDFVKKKTVIVRAGKKYVARAKR
jgi:CSLREA domain-containing protein